MRRMKRALGENSSEASWIATTDIFIVGCCVMFYIAHTVQRRNVEVEAQLLGSNSVFDLETERGKSQLPTIDVGALLSERNDLDAKLKAAEENASRASAQRQQDERALSQKNELLAVKVSQLEKSLEDARNYSDELIFQIEASKREATRNREDDLSRQRRVNNKLVGLGGKLEKVVFVVDISTSMRDTRGENGEILNNWRPTVETIERWITGLHVTSAALIVFGEGAELKVPMQNLDDGGREMILDELKLIEPNGTATNFLAAFEMAYQIPGLDTIIVFSDGLPSVDVHGKRIFVGSRTPGESESEYQIRVASEVEVNVGRALAVHQKISEMAKQHSGVAVNVIGLGSGVYNKKTGNLLNDLALKNGGVFLAFPSRILDNNSEVEK